MKGTRNELFKMQALVCTSAGLLFSYLFCNLIYRLGGSWSKDSLSVWHEDPLPEDPDSSVHCQWNSTWLHPATPLTDKCSVMLNQHSFKQLSFPYSASEERGKLGLAQQQDCSNASFLGRQASLEVRKLQFHSERTGCSCPFWCETWEICELFIHTSIPPDRSSSFYSSQSMKGFLRLSHSGFSVCI